MWIIESWESSWCKNDDMLSLFECLLVPLSAGRATDAWDTDHKMEVNWPTWQFQTLKANHSYFPSRARHHSEDDGGGTVEAFRVMILLRRLFGEWGLTRESLVQAVGIADFSRQTMLMRQHIPFSNLLLENRIFIIWVLDFVKLFWG